MPLGIGSYFISSDTAFLLTLVSPDDIFFDMTVGIDDAHGNPSYLSVCACYPRKRLFKSAIVEAWTLC
jgi:hypothetical protein